MEMESRKFLCSTIRVWATVFGWIHVIGSCLTVLAIIIFSISYLEKNDGSLLSGIVILAIIILVSLLIIFLGTRLLVAIKERDTRKMILWVVVEGILTTISAITLLIIIFRGETAGLAGTPAILVSILKMWLVLQYRKEVLEFERLQIQTQAATLRQAELNSATSLHGSPII